MNKNRVIELYEDNAGGLWLAPSDEDIVIEVDSSTEGFLEDCRGYRTDWEPESTPGAVFPLVSAESFLRDRQTKWIATYHVSDGAITFYRQPEEMGHAARKYTASSFAESAEQTPPDAATQDAADEYYRLTTCLQILTRSTPSHPYSIDSRRLDDPEPIGPYLQIRWLIDQGYLTRYNVQADESGNTTAFLFLTIEGYVYTIQTLAEAWARLAGQGAPTVTAAFASDNIGKALSYLALRFLEGDEVAKPGISTYRVTDSNGDPVGAVVVNTPTTESSTHG